MKLVVTIPALNEENTIAQVIGGIPRDIPGISETEVIVVNDGSTDRTPDMVRAEFPEATLHRFDRSRGLIVRRNNGALLARGKVIWSRYFTARAPRMPRAAENKSPTAQSVTGNV